MCEVLQSQHSTPLTSRFTNNKSLTFKPGYFVSLFQSTWLWFRQSQSTTGQTLLINQPATLISIFNKFYCVFYRHLRHKLTDLSFIFDVHLNVCFFWYWNYIKSFEKVQSLSTCHHKKILLINSWKENLGRKSVKLSIIQGLLKSVRRVEFSIYSI